MKHTILVVDDEIDNVEALERLFRRKYRVLKATSGEEGLAHLKNENVSLIVTDQRMPNMTGVEFLVASMKHCPEAIRILLTGFTDIDSVIGAINSGQVYRYITKPWDPVDLANSVDKAIERYELSAELKIKNRELVTALNELKVLDTAKSNFMILINHELKTPLTVILSYIELLNESSLNDEQTKFVQRVSSAADRLRSLIEDSLQLVQAETGALKVDKGTVKAQQLVQNLSSHFAGALSEKKMTLELGVHTKSIKADANILQSVLQRLIDNAIKFGKANSKISLNITEEPEGIVFTILNEGKALSQEIIKQILKPFNLNEDVMHHTKGTGLGLSVSQALLHCHDSELRIQCPDGHFEVSFTLRQ